ncbi:MAG: nucleotidyl transferase AbiEii/AbiGii toxin family protein [Candidatus Thermoplasmatota archaeon]|nr:nucleotidyl transferase AbiEii/AbiGii toxin family protein [Candidatus Thermoplasmatota archaeon]
MMELDYIQSILLRHIYAKNRTPVFKGGTCLRKVHGLNRYSEDLDFNMIGGDPEELLRDGIKGLERTGIPARIVNKDDRKNVFLARLRYQGPLYNGTSISEGSMELEFSKYEVRHKPEWNTVMEKYPDTGTFMIRTMAKEEILAEKIRSLVQRKKVRDLYDVWFMLEKGFGLSEKLVESKFRDVGMEPIGIEKILECYVVTDNEWERDMKNLINMVPGLENIRGSIVKTISDMGPTHQIDIKPEE